MIKLKSLIIERSTLRNFDVEIDKLEQEWERLDSMGGQENKQKEISKKLDKIRKEKERWEKLYGAIKEENINGGINKDITINDVNKMLDDEYLNWEIKSTLNVIYDFYYSEDETKRESIKNYLDLLNNVKKKVVSIGNNLGIPHINEKSIINQLLSYTEFKENINEFFPFPIYISASPTDNNTIGILVDENGKVLELFEGNDEASPETINLVNKLLNPSGKPVRIYASHDTNLIHKIQKDGMLPANLYVSPNQTHARTHLLDLEGDRSMFTGIIDINSVSQESDIDWKTIEPTEITKFRWL